jgi:hypothetical protein
MKVDMKFEVAIVPVSDVDRTKASFRLDTLVFSDRLRRSVDVETAKRECLTYTCRCNRNQGRRFLETSCLGRVNLNQICGMKLHPGDLNTEFFEGRND